MSSFSVSSRFPNRRRAAQACVACRMRKTRCDAATPRCGWCEMHDIECVYRDAQQPRMNYDTQVILERIQLMEDRLSGQQAAQLPSQQPRLQQQTQPGHPLDTSDLDVQIALSHTANANHVFSWPIAQQMLKVTASLEDEVVGDATDVFFYPSTHPAEPAPSSWKIYEGTELTPPDCLNLINLYFTEVNVFFPLLARMDMVDIHDAVLPEHSCNDHTSSITPSSYCLLLLALALASFIKSGRNIVHDPSDEQPHARTSDDLDERLWRKAKLLLGTVSAELSVTAAQCTMLASLYRGAKGRVAESFHWSHAAAAKCEALARYYIRGRQSTTRVPENFSRLFWIAFIYEGDFVSEISVTLPSGIAKYDDLIPYPTFNGAGENADPAVVQQEELVAFQITTNASIRRFLNRVNAAIYNAKEQQRQQQDHDADHISWLLRVSQDLWAHHAAVYRSLPEFLLRSSSDAGVSPAGESPTARIEGLMPRGNNPWNILRLKGRYYAGQYIIHRPFIEYALLNADRFDTHPQRAAIIANCATCLHGCMGFIRVFGTEPANTISCLFATGMVVFTMVIILMVATVTPLFRDILPTDIEESIALGIRNLKKFSVSVEEFSWHLRILERLETARHNSHHSSA